MADQIGSETSYNCLLAISNWQSFYRRHFNIDVDFSSVRIPEYQEEFERIILMPRGLTREMILKALKIAFPVFYYYDDFDAAEKFNCRDALQGSYAIRVRDCVRADNQLKNLSARNLEQMGIAGITLPERRIYELKYFDETGRHLDDSGTVTLCSGTTDALGNFSGVRWHDEKLDLDWYEPQQKSSNLRARAVMF
ncbi:MAG: hypothetical protein V1661_01635 [bacterium]